MNVVIYARYSSSAQTEQSIEGQLRVCREYAEKKGFNILHEYIDRAMTGTNDNRPEFQRMIADSKKQNFKFVLVYKLDRFSRSKYDNAIYKHKLQENGVKVISATEAISDTPEGIMMEGLLEMFAEMYSKDLSQKVKRGMRENVLKGLTIGGKVLYGYKVENKRVIINEEQAPAVKFMFKEYANGTSKKDIVKQLNNMGYRTNAGQKFTINSIQDKLSNRKYLGEYKNDYIDSKDYFPKLIDQTTFDNVQEKLKHNKRYTSKPKEEFILAGKVFCGHCGASMIGTSGTSHTGKSHSYYTCLERNKRHNCDKSNENKQKLENEIFNRIYEKVLTPEKIDFIADKLVKDYENETSVKKIKEYESKIQAIEKEISNITQLMLKAKNDKVIEQLDSQANDLTEQEKTYQEQINKLKLATRLCKTKEEIKTSLQIYLNGEPNNIEYQKRLINTFIKAIYVFDNYNAVYFNWQDEEQELTFDKVKEHEKQAEQEFAHQVDCSTRQKHGESRAFSFITKRNFVCVLCWRVLLKNLCK